MLESNLLISLGKESYKQHSTTQVVQKSAIQYLKQRIKVKRYLNL